MTEHFYHPTSTLSDFQDFLPLEYLRDYAFCPRLYGLYYLEGFQVLSKPNDSMPDGLVLKEENGLTARFPLFSKLLGLHGIVPWVSFLSDERGIRMPGKEGRWLPVAVLTRNGHLKPEPHERVYLCAQTICLEEMFGLKIERALFISEEKTEYLNIDFALRESTIRLSKELHRKHIKPASFCVAVKHKCLRCPAKKFCIPELNSTPSVKDYTENAMQYKPI